MHHFRPLLLALLCGTVLGGGATAAVARSVAAHTPSPGVATLPGADATMPVVGVLLLLASAALAHLVRQSRPAPPPPANVDALDAWRERVYAAA